MQQRGVSSDYYLNNKQAVEKQDAVLNKMGINCETVPVDLNGGLVPTEKTPFMETTGLSDIETNIRERFSLGSADSDESTTY